MSLSERSARRGRWPLAVGLLLAMQLMAAGVYLLIERERAPPLDDDLSFERLDLPLAAVSLERPGARKTLADEGLLLLHLWATWCRPCRAELPTVLALEGEVGVPVIAASTDEGWRVIEHYFDGDTPSPVWRVSSGGEGLPVRTLPTTLVVKEGRVLARVEGARRWSPEGVRELLASVARMSPPEDATKGR